MAFVRTEGPEGVVLAIPPSYYRSRGGFMAVFGLLFGSCLCCLPFGLIASGEGIDEAGDLLVVLMLLGLLVGVLVPVMGGLIALHANKLANASSVRLDADALRTQDGRTFPHEAIACFVLAKSTRGTLIVRGWPRWQLIDVHGAMHALSEGVHPFLDRKRTARLLAGVAEGLGKPFEDRSRDLGHGVSATICYLPIGALFLPTSILVLFGGRDEKVRFAAKQSLLHFAFTLGLAVVGGGFCVATFVATDLLDASPGLVAIPALLLLLTLFTMNVVLRFYAMYRASRDPLWVMPWLGRISRPWANRIRGEEPLKF